MNADQDANESIRQRAIRGRAFELRELSGWPDDAGDWISVRQQAPFQTAAGRRGRVDLVVQIDDGSTVIIETKSTDWDRIAPHRVRANARRHIRQLLRYVDEFDQNQGVHPALVYPSTPSDAARRRLIEEMGDEALVEIVWRDGS